MGIKKEKAKKTKSNPLILLVVVSRSGAVGATTIEVFDPKKPPTPERLRGEIRDIISGSFDYDDENSPVKVYRYDIA